MSWALCLLLALMPSVLGQSGPEAERVLREAGCRVVVLPTSAPEPHGQVVSQMPDPGVTLQEPAVVRIWVAVQGPPPSPVLESPPAPAARSWAWLAFLLFQPILALGLWRGWQAVRCVD